MDSEIAAGDPSPIREDGVDQLSRMYRAID
jgi:hypothetical protein